jgi:hypothetical protein
VLKFFTSLLKLAVLLYLLTLEQVLGLPFLFILLTLIWLDHNHNQPYRLLTLLLITSFGLAVVFDFAWLISWLLLIAGHFLVQLGQDLVQSRQRRLLLAALISSLAVLWLTQTQLRYISLAQLIVSYLLLILWLRLFKDRRRGQLV